MQDCKQQTFVDFRENTTNDNNKNNNSSNSNNNNNNNNNNSKNSKNNNTNNKSTTHHQPGRSASETLKASATTSINAKKHVSEYLLVPLHRRSHPHRKLVMPRPLH